MIKSLCKLVVATAITFTLSTANLTAFAATETYPLDSIDNLTLSKVVAEPTTYKGIDSVAMKLEPGEPGSDINTVAVVEGTNLHNGTIEVDLVGAIAPDAPFFARGFVGLAFRIDDEISQFESIYLRPGNSHAEDPVSRSHSVQYFSFPDYSFEVLRAESPDVYESYADLEVGEWMHMLIEVDGEEALLYVNYATEPTLVVNDLKLGADAEGAVGLWTDAGTEAYFANLKITD